MTEEKKLLVILNEGTNNPSRATRAFQMAKIAKEKGIDVTVFLVDDAVYLAKKGVADKVKAPTGDELKPYLEYLKENNVQVMICTPCAASRGISSEELVENAKLETGYTLIALTMESKTLCF